jgi:hypothetical protein
MGEHCIHEQDWGRVLTRLEELYKDFYGNGQPGAMDVISGLRLKVDDLYLQSNANAKSISAIAKFVTESEAVDSYKKEERLSAAQRTVVIVTAIVGIAGAAAAYLA